MPKFGAARDQPTLAFIAGGVSSSEGRERITLRLSALAMFIADNELELPPTFHLPSVSPKVFCCSYNNGLRHDSGHQSAHSRGTEWNCYLAN